MHDKLKLFLEKISLPSNYYEAFENGKILKLKLDSTRKNGVFIIEIEDSLPRETLEYINHHVNEGFPEMNNIKTEFVIRNTDYTKMGDYYESAIENSALTKPMKALFKEKSIVTDGIMLLIKVNNIAEENIIRKHLDNIQLYYKKLGFEKANISIIIDEEAAEAFKAKLKEEINKGPLNSKKKENPVIFGEASKGKITDIKDIIMEEANVTVEAYVFATEEFESSKSNFKILTLKISDRSDSIYAKFFTKDERDFKKLSKGIKKGEWYRINGYVKQDIYAKDLVLNVRSVIKIASKDNKIIDDAPEKRVELHTHTMMSQMDGLTKVDLAKHTVEIVDEAIKWGHKAVAITDHNGVQAFPIAYSTVRDYNKKLPEGKEPFKVLYGTELMLIDDTIKIVVRPNDTKLIDNTYVVFDLETTGFNAGGGDTIIEIGAVKLKNGEIIDRFDKLINPGHKLNSKITEVTSITDAMLQGKPSEEQAVKEFINWFEDYPVVAHNAKFDTSFIEMAYQKYNLGTFNNPVIDTLELSRTLDNNFARHSLSALVKRYSIPFDEESHHRGDYDAEATALVYHKMMEKLISRNYEKIKDLDNLVSKDEIHKYGRGYHVNLIARNKVGLKNLFKIISLANTKYLYKTPRILRSEIENKREGILVGSGCYESEVFVEARSKSNEELINIINFYDYVEVQPPEVYDHLLQMGDFASKEELLDNIKKIIKTTEDAGKIIVATGDVHHLTREDKIFREIIVNQKVPGGGRHPLSRKNITEIPSQHFRTTKEMLSDFSFLSEKKAKEIVITNTNKIADMVEIIEVIIETGGIPFSPKIDNCAEITTNMVYDKAKSMYGNPLPNFIEERIKQELKGIIGGGFDVIYLIAQKLVKKSNDDGYLVGSRGSVGSSFVATMMGITEVNPLSAHYRCLKCKHSIFEDELGESLGATYSSGFDLPNLNCPKCGSQMYKDGQDMPFATFLGFNADKVPDIDLNFSGLNQASAHEYTKVLFGVDNVYRAGTIGTVADKTAFGYVKGYCEEKGVTKRSAEVERLAAGCTGVKRTTGQHPGGIVVIPNYMEVYDFTPFQFPADDVTSTWRTTHFDYHAIDQDVLKLDILGHDDPTVLRMLQDLSGIDVTKIDLGDKDTMKIFSGPEILGVTKEQIMCETGTLGIPEFGTKFVISMLVDTKPTSFSELIKISGLSHGTDVWVGNAQDLIRNNIVPFKEVIGCRDDIMVYLMYHNVEPIKAFKIMEFVRKGRASKDPDTWKEYVSIMEEAGIVDWFIDSCFKIKYMFPKAHAAAYVMSAYRIAWFKVHHPMYYYCAYFSIRCSDFDIITMIKGYDEIKRKMVELNNKGYDISNKENGLLGVFELALEYTARGFSFKSIDLYKSHSKNFVIDDDSKSLIPPFNSVDGLGDTVAENIVIEREKGSFISVEDLQIRAKISSTLIEKLRMMGVLNDMPESSQLSLF
ncbi:MAG: PolC-type DNA polymerase III [Bacilli bacterium]